MTFVEAMKRRYTTKVYDASKTINEKDIEELKEILRLSPSSINSQPWRFIFVTDEKIKNELAKASYFNEQKIKDCALLVVLSSTSSVPLYEQWMNEALQKGSIDYYNEFVRQKEESQILAWFDHQVYLSLGILLGACAMMGLDSSPMEGIEAIKYDAILDLANHHSVCAVAVGYRAADDYNQPDKTPKDRRAPDEVIKSV